MHTGDAPLVMGMRGGEGKGGKGRGDEGRGSEGNVWGVRGEGKFSRVEIGN